jgi:hypothetical protein
MGPVRNGVFYFWIFLNETWHMCRWAWKNNNLKVSLKLRSWTNFTASRSWRKYFFTIVCRIWLVKTATECLSLVPRRKGMDFYRASNSREWGALWIGAVCRGCVYFAKFFADTRNFWSFKSPSTILIILQINIFQQVVWVQDMKN